MTRSQAAPLEVALSVESPLWDVVPNVEALVQRAALAAFQDAFQDADAAEVSIALVDDSMIRALNRDFRGQDKPTNVLSFPAPPLAAPGGPRLIGDIAIAYETTAAEAEAEGKALPAHLAHLVVHGMLHLVGHDHLDPQQADRMESIERAILAALGIADPYAACAD